MSKDTYPRGIEVGEAVLGILLVDPDAWLDVSTEVEVEDFGTVRQQWIFEAIRDLHGRGEGVDQVSVFEELKDHQRAGKGKVERHELTRLANLDLPGWHTADNARRLRRIAVTRRLMQECSGTFQEAHRANGNLGEVLDNHQARVMELALKRAGQRGASARDLAKRYLDRVEHIQQNGLDPGLSTGLYDLDELLGGLQRTDLVILAGRPGMGKTALALSIALHASHKLQKRVAFFSLEMSDEQLAQRLLANLSGIDGQRLRVGDIRDEEWPLFMQATEQLAACPLHVDDTAGLSVMELRNQARRQAVVHGLDLLVVDYLQLMRGDGVSENRQQEISYISRNLKALAKELNVPLLALSQLSRAVENRSDKRPWLSDLRESGSIEQDSDVVVFLYRDDYYNPDSEFPNIVEIIVSKQRSGPTGILSAYFRKEQGQFVDLEVRRHTPDFYLPEEAQA